jgi:hypothetical protein
MRLSWLVFLAVGAGLGGPKVLAPGNDPETVAADEQTLKAAGLASDGPAVLEFFRKRTLPDSDRDRLKTLVTQLGDDSFEVREKASAALVARGAAAERLLTAALKSPDAEVARRAEECLRLIKQGAATAVPLAAARVVERRRPAGAASVLLAYLPFADNETVADEVRHALAAVAVRDGQPDPALVAGLTDRDGVRRAAAAEALARAAAPDLKPTVLKVLQDPDPLVRLRVALALAQHQEKSAIPVLIELLGRLAPDQAWAAEDLLLRLAGDQPPAVALGTDDSSRRRCQAAWTEWWNRNSARVDLAKLHGPPPTLGYTLLLFLDAPARAIEVDSRGKERWQIQGLDFPLDVQYLPGNRLLFAEHHGNRVTERTIKGDIVWEKRVESPLMAQRLPNGHTFIATAGRLLEVDPAGREVWSYQATGNDSIMKAIKLPNGEIACVMTGARFVRMDASGKELRGFPVNVQYYGGRIDVFPNGRVLIPETRNNRVVEYDPSGKIVWQAEVEQPIAAVRLANGNTLVTSGVAMNPPYKAVELDRKGKTAWEYESETRVNRAFRR